MKTKATKWDNWDRAKLFSWRGYLLTYLVLLALSAGQALIYAEYIGFDVVPPSYIWGMLGYWAFVTAVFSLITARQKVLAFDRPMQNLSKAAEQVAKGDFSVYLEPAHRPDRRDYVDVMFDDFNKMVEELGSIETLKDDFIASVSHEFKTPLAVIQNYAVALKKENLSQETRQEYAETIITASQNLTELVVNILKLNKLENQEIVPVSEPFDLCRQLCDSALAFESIWEDKNIEFEANIEDRAMVWVDESMLEIVWHNLLSNAFKFTEPGGKVTLTQTSDEDFVIVTIADTGCGMDEETMNHIFTKFYQGDTSHSGEGNGLGLALSLRVIELLGGSISVKSGPGRGTIFTVELPIKPNFE